MPDRSGDIVGAIGHMKKKGAIWVVVLGFAIGAGLLIVGSVAFNDGDGEKADNQKNDNVEYLSFTEYKEAVKREIEETCLCVGGVKSAHAAVFFDGVGESKYAQNYQSGNTEKSEYVIIGTGSSSHALYLGESLPPLSGIGVVCDTGGSDALKNEIAALLAATYGLPLTRIYVSEG